VPIQLVVSTTPTRFSAASRARAGGGTEAHRKGETGHHDPPSYLGHDPSTGIGSVKEGRLAGGCPLPDWPSLYSHVPALAKRHKVEAKKDSASAQELLVKQAGTYGEAELCKLLLEISLLDSAYQRSTASRNDVLMDAAKRYRVDAEKLQKAVAEELVAKREKKTKRKAKTRSQTAA
jgi:hypothetical protein